jgi:hypothetical protein
MRGRTAGNDRNDPDWLGPSRVSLGIQCRRNTVDRYRRAHACSGTGRRAPGPTVEQSRQNSLRRLARRPSRRCRCRAGCAGFGAKLLTLMPDHSLGLGDFLLCPALHVDLLAERGDRLPELLAGRLDVSPHFVDAGVGARLFVRCCHSPAALTVWMSCLTLSTDFCTTTRRRHACVECRPRSQHRRATPSASARRSHVLGRRTPHTCLRHPQQPRFDACCVRIRNQRNHRGGSLPPPN